MPRFPDGFSLRILWHLPGRVLVPAPFLQQQPEKQRKKPEFPGGRIFIARTEDECLSPDSRGRRQPGKHPLEIEWGMNTASGFSPPQRWALSTSLLRMIKGNNCALTTRIDISKWKRNEEQILGGLPLMRMDFPGQQPFTKSDFFFFFLF